MTPVQPLNTQNEVLALADSEPALIERVKNRDQGAFRKLYDRHLPMVYGLCLRMTGAKALAEDAAQEAFILAWRKIEGFRGDSSFSTWLHSLTVNSTISFLRRHKSWLQRMTGGSDYNDAVENLTDDAPTDVSDLMHWLPHLPERARLVFVLHGIEGYRQEQVARTMGISVGTVKAQYHKASTQLKQWLGYENGAHS